MEEEVIPQENSQDGKRFNCKLSPKAWETLTKLAEKRDSSMTEVVRLALGITKLIIEETEQGNKLMICKSDGQVIKEVVLPE
jgi:hypothetical protein